MRPLPLLKSWIRKILQSVHRAPVVASASIETHREPPQHKILLACFPKSGSTFITGKMAALPGWESISLVPFYGRRDQELDAPCLDQAMRSTGCFVSHHHTRCSENTIVNCNKYGLDVIVLTRDLKDVAVSLSDHWDNESLVGPTCYLNPDLLMAVDRDPDLTRLRLIVRHVLPWYISFFLSWRHHCNEIGGKVVWISYEDFFGQDLEASFESLLQELGIFVPSDAVHQVISDSTTPARRNKGVQGRGATAFSNDAAAYEDLIRLLACYPTTDFSRIFTPL